MPWLKQCGKNTAIKVCAKVNIIATLANALTHLVQIPKGKPRKLIECDMERDSDILNQLIVGAFVKLLEEDATKKPITTIDATKCPKLAECFKSLELAIDAVTIKKMRNKFKRQSVGFKRRIDVVFTPEIEKGAIADWGTRCDLPNRSAYY